MVDPRRCWSTIRPASASVGHQSCTPGREASDCHLSTAPVIRRTGRGGKAILNGDVRRRPPALSSRFQHVDRTYARAVTRIVPLKPDRARLAKMVNQLVHRRCCKVVRGDRVRPARPPDMEAGAEVAIGTAPRRAGRWKIAARTMGVADRFDFGLFAVDLGCAGRVLCLDAAAAQRALGPCRFGGAVRPVFLRGHTGDGRRALDTSSLDNGDCGRRGPP